MNITAWIDVAIGLSVVHLGASLFVTIINEYVQHLLNLRGRNLAASLCKLITEPTVREHLKNSPALAPFFEKSGGLFRIFKKEYRDVPSYVDPVVVAKLLIGSLAAGAKPANGAEALLKTLENLEDVPLKPQLQALVKATTDNVDALVTATSEWLDRSLTLLSEGYKRRLHWINFAISLSVAIAFNIDTIALTTRLYHDKEAREAAVALAERVTTATDEETFNHCVTLDRDELVSDPTCKSLMGLAEAVTSRNASLTQLPLGWDEPHPKDPGQWALKGLGWLLAALALSLGAPFWFDMLSRFVSVRHGIRKPSVEPRDTKLRAE